MCHWRAIAVVVAVFGLWGVSACSATGPTVLVVVQLDPSLPEVTQLAFTVDKAGQASLGPAFKPDEAGPALAQEESVRLAIPAAYEGTITVHVDAIGGGRVVGTGNDVGVARQGTETTLVVTIGPAPNCASAGCRVGCCDTGDCITDGSATCGGTGGGAGGGGGGAGGGGGGGGPMGTPYPCDAGFRLVTSPLTGNIQGLWVTPTGAAWFGTNTIPYVASREPGAAPVAQTAGCANAAPALWVNPVTGAAYYAGTFGQVARLDAIDAGTCPSAGVTGTTAAASGMIGRLNDGGYDIYVTHADGRIARIQDGASSNTSQVADVLEGIDGIEGGQLFAVGSAGAGQGRGYIARLAGSGTWVTSLQVGANDSRFGAVSAVSASLAYAAGRGASVYRYNGTSWSSDMQGPGFQVRGLKAFAPDAIYAVGESSNVLRWDGVAWRTVASFSGPSRIYDIRGSSECSLWVVGDTGLIATNEP